MDSVAAPNPVVRYQVDDLTIDVERHSVHRNGVELPLPPRSYELLVALIRAHPRMLSIDDLLTKVWAPAVVNPETVGTRVKLLRKALGDDQNHQRYLISVRGQGYRLAPAVVPLGATGTTTPATAPQPEAPPLVRPRNEPRAVEPSLSGRGFRGGVWGAAGLVLVALVVLAVAVFAWRARPARDDGTAQTPSLAAVQAIAAKSPAPPEKSIAILPFLDLTEKKDEAYFADGMTEEITAMLSEASDLKVSARTSAYYFKDLSVPVRDIGRALGAANVLEGSVRKSGELLRVTVQLIRTDTGYHLWSGSYDRKPSDLFSTESEIARVVVDRLKASLRDSSAFRERLSADLTARGLFFKSLTAVYHNSGDGDEQATRNLRQAVKIDPHFATAWTLLSIATHDLQEGHRAADRALQIDPLLPDAHVAKAMSLQASDWDVAAALVEVNRAIELDPNDSFALRNAAELQADLGHFEVAERLAREAADRAAIDAFAHRTLGWILANNGKPAAALEELHNAVSLNPSSGWIHHTLVWVQFLNGNPAAALDSLNAPEIYPGARQVMRPLLLDALGRHAQADREQAIAEQQCGRWVRIPMAWLYAYRGDKDKAFAWLEKALQAHEDGLVDLKVQPIFAALRADPRYRVLLQKLKLPE